MPSVTRSPQIRLAVIWMDWYAYHIARLEGMLSVPGLEGRVAGIELVGGIGVHPGLKFREEISSCLPVHTLMPHHSWRDAGQWRLSRMLWEKLSSLNPAAVMVPGYATLPALSAALWARMHGRPSILMTESTAYDHKRIPWKEFVKSLLIRSLFDFAIAGGKAHIRYLEQLAFPRAKVARYYDVVDNEFLFSRTTALRQSKSDSIGLPVSPYFLYVGRLAPEKNVDGLLSAWLQYRHEGGTWPLVLVGDGASGPQLQQQAQASNYKADVYFAGHRGSGELPLFYAFAGCFVLSSVREPWGLVVNEAMASGLPVLVSSQCGSAEDLVEEGRNGFTFNPISTNELVRHMQYISALSSAGRRHMGNESLEIISRFSPRNFGQQVMSLLDMGGV